MKNKTFKKAFTMAEAILVMTILGIIATIALTTLKPAQYKDQALAISAKKVLGEIDSAVTSIMLNDSSDGTFINLLQLPASGTRAKLTVGTTANSAELLLSLFKKYMVVTRKTVSTTSFCVTGGQTTSLALAKSSAYLKDGACIGIYTMSSATTYDTIFPEEENVTSSKVQNGLIFFDTNGDAEPNAKGKDQFILPIYKEGIDYSVEKAST